MNVMLLSDYETGKLLILMSEMLHLMLISSDALAIECDVRHAAFGHETIRCTLTIVLISGLLHPVSLQSDEKQLIFKLLHSIAIRLNALTMLSDVRKTAPDFERSNALTKLSDCQIAALDRETIKCTLTIVCCESSLIRRFSR